VSGVPPRNYSTELAALGRNAGAFDTAEAKKLAAAYGGSLQDLIHAYLCLRYLVERGDVNATAPKGIRILYGKLVEGVGAVLFLLERGFPGPAAQIFRSTLETSVALQVVLRDAEAIEERALLFEEFLLAQRFDNRFGPGVTAEKRAEAEKAFERVRSNYHPTHRHSWAWKICPSTRLQGGVPNNPTFKDLCVFVGHPEFHSDLYGYLSDTTHPVPGYEVWLRGGDGNMFMGPKSSVHVPPLARLACAFSMGALIAMLDFLKPPDKTELKVFYAKVLLKPDQDEEQPEEAGA
jgi:hypothetical protein